MTNFFIAETNFLSSTPTHAYSSLGDLIGRSGEKLCRKNAPWDPFRSIHSLATINLLDLDDL